MARKITVKAAGSGKDPGGRIFLANVGANRSHAVQSPLFPDGTFELVPIPERDAFQAEPAPRYGDLRCFNSAKTLADYLPARYSKIHAHRDPDFGEWTYGDLCHYAPRAAGLKRLRPGDRLFFLARLVPFREDRFDAERGGFFLVGVLEIEEVFAEIREAPPGRIMRRIRRNAHVLRGLMDPAHFDGFWVFTGTENSRLYHKAVPVDRRLAERVFRDARGRPWVWEGRSELQVIGSYTRSCRMVIDPNMPRGAKAASALLFAVQKENPEVHHFF